ncbi:hypothetical protein PSHT_08320 [Puccinia striiformis]|uniref:Uncharacterized protein n=1 Tax=Puccinia striiformis TaxID=27350 RepID=A0A2S4VQA9_9BASI|nr:hypothetical protein PSHT_08320 [Puccinia striiformis]
MLLPLIAPADSTPQCFSFYLFHLAPILPWPIYNTSQFPTFPPHNRTLHPRQANSSVTLSTLMTTAITPPDYMSTPPSPTLSPSLHPQSSRLNTASLPSPLSVYRGSLFQPCHLQLTRSVFSTTPALQRLPIHSLKLLSASPQPAIAVATDSPLKHHIHCTFTSHITCPYLPSPATMSTTRTPNHPAIVSGLFEAIQESSVPTTQGNQYGLVHTLSFLQCSGLKKDKLEDFQINLQTNTALTNILLPHMLYYLFLPTAQHSLDLVLLLTSRRLPPMTPNPATPLRSLLLITIGTQRKFNVKYIIPGTRYFIKTHPIYWREVHIVGQIVDFEMESHLTIVLPYVWPPASKTHCKRLSRWNSIHLWSTTFAGSATPTTLSLSAGKKSFTTPLLSSAAKAIEPESSDSDGTSTASTSDKSDEEESPLPATPAKRGRPRRDVIKQAAKK